MSQPKFKYLDRFRRRIYIVIFGTETKAGRYYDLGLLYLIIASIIIVMLESVKEIKLEYGDILATLEWFFTVLFTIEYFTRIFVLHRPAAYIFSFFGIIDLMAILPTYITLIYTGGQALVVIRAIRLLRIFRILHLPQFMSEARVLGEALKSSLYKITIFLVVIISTVLIVGTLMYIIEGGQHGFTSIPRSIYWAIVTITTVGYGDIAPTTILGQTFAAFLMLIGYAIIAVPTGIVTAEIASAHQNEKERHEHVSCATCGANLKPTDNYCHNCGEKVLKPHQ